MRRGPHSIRAAAAIAAIGLMLLGGCAATPADTAQQPSAASPTPPSASPTTAAAPTASPTLAAPTASPTLAAPTASPTLAATTEATSVPIATAEPSLFAPIVDVTGGYLLGGIEGTRWLTTEVAAPSVQGGEAYRIVTDGQVTGEGRGGAARPGEVPCDWLHEVEIEGAPTQQQEVPIAAQRGTLAVGGSWELFPRRPQDLPTSMAVYRDALASELAARGIAEPNVQLGQIVRVDLDGDGVDEVLLNATYYRSQAEENYLSPNAAAGDYSLVLLRTLVDGQVVTVPIAENYYVKDEEFVAPLEHVLAEVIDLNGDGMLDVVVRSSYYEGSFITVHEVVGATVTAVMSEGCGV